MRTTPSQSRTTTRKFGVGYNTGADQASAMLGDLVDSEFIERHRLNRLLRLSKLQRIIATLRDLIESESIV